MSMTHGLVLVLVGLALFHTIWVHSAHNGSGYYSGYGEEVLQSDHFSSRLSFGDTQTVWARTGYLGFLRRTELTDASGERHDALYVVGALEEAMELRGMRYHPIDIETSVIRTHKSIVECAVFPWTNLLVVVVELEGSEQEALDLVPMVTKAVLEEHYLIVGVVVVTDIGVIPHQLADCQVCWVLRRAVQVISGPGCRLVCAVLRCAVSGGNAPRTEPNQNHSTVDFDLANGRFSVCQFHWELQRSKEVCQTEMNKQPLYTKGCHTEWDNISCWQHAVVGDIQNQTCPPALLMLFGKYGTISRNCTETGWSDVYPSSFSICWSDNSDEPNKLVFYRVVKIIYTLGHSLSLIALLTSTLILSLFRRLHCTRNYIHLNLFLSFILRAVAVLVKDTIIFSHSEHADCSTVPSLVGCKISMVFFNYFIMANFFWLLVEGLYLHMLLMVMHNYHVHLSTYMLIGWGIPFVFTGVWVVCKICLDDILCWEKDGDPTPKRVLNWPIMASVIINFVLFINIIRILVQKIRCSDVGGNDKCQYRRLAKSTLLLIPLFGVNYIVFIYLVEPAEQSQEEYKMLFDLGLGSFQGLVVAILYCFLNSEVQGELKRKWRSLSLKRYVGRDYRLRTTSVSRKDADNFAHLPRNSRAQSILQTETSML
ncbi:unnamed protein product [Merluccius merluccius]